MTKDGISYYFQVYTDTFKTKKKNVMDLVQEFPSLDGNIIKEKLFIDFELLISQKNYICRKNVWFLRCILNWTFPIGKYKDSVIKEERIGMKIFI